MHHGCRLNDYSATVGVNNCINVELTDNLFVFLPPDPQPKKPANDSFCSERTLPVTVFALVIMANGYVTSFYSEENKITTMRCDSIQKVP